MQAMVTVAGAVDERDLWPYATWYDSDDTTTTLTVRVHDSQELVAVLATLTSLGLDVLNTHLLAEPQPPVDRGDTGPPSSDRPL
ncbi:hypothetical protein [Terrabacter sp. NPDC080008]|uniref:hypothetical protein n=1 Tax=Terrabacter sp. NPDC080008 TaxID=3155176 RepID=UPI00344C5F25